MVCQVTQALVGAGVDARSYHGQMNLKSREDVHRFIKTSRGCFCNLFVFMKFAVFFDNDPKLQEKFIERLHLNLSKAENHFDK